MTHKVAYETFFSDTKAARERFMRAMLLCHAAVDFTRAQQLHKNGDITLIVCIQPDAAQMFQNVAKVELRYKWSK